MDEMEVQSQVIDLTRRLAAPTDPTNVASTSKPANNNNISKAPSSGGDNSMPFVSVDALQGTSFSSVKDVTEMVSSEAVIVASDAGGNSLVPPISVDAVQGTMVSSVKDGKEKVSAEPVIVVSDAGEDGKEDSYFDDVAEVKMRDKNESQVASKVRFSESTLLDANNLLDYLSDSSGSPPEVILVPDDNENTISTLELKNKMNKTKSSGKQSTFENKNLLDSGAPKKESFLPWRKLADNSQKGHALLGSEDDVPRFPSKVTADTILGNFKNSLASSSRKEDISSTATNQKLDFELNAFSGVKMTPVCSSNQKYPEVRSQPSTSSVSLVSRAVPNIIKGRDSTHLEPLNERRHSTPERFSGSSNMGSAAGLPTSRSGNMPLGSNLATSSTCRIHRGIKHCECKGLTASTKSADKELLHKAGVQKDPILHRGLDSRKSHLQSFPLKGTSETVTNATASKDNSQTPQHSGKDFHAGSSSEGIVTKRVEPLKKSFDLEKPHPGTPQPIKQAGLSLPVRTQITSGIHTVHRGSSSQAVGQARETSQQTLNSTESTTQAASQTGVRKSQEVTQTAGISYAGRNPTGTFLMGNTMTLTSTNHSTVTSQISQNKRTDTLGKAQTGPQSSPAFGARFTQAGTVSNPAARPQSSSAQANQNNRTDTPGNTLKRTHSSPGFHSRHLQARTILDPTIRVRPPGVPPDTPRPANLPASPSVHQRRNNIHVKAATLVTPNLPGTSLANVTSPGNTQTVRMADLRFTQPGRVLNPIARPQPSSAQVSQYKGTGTPGKAQTLPPQSPLAFHVRHLQVQGGTILNPTARVQPPGVQPAGPRLANMSQLSKAISQLRNDINAVSRAGQNLPGITQANVIAPGNTQTVRMAQQVLGNTAFLPRNVALYQNQRQNNTGPENGFPLPQQRAPTPAVQIGIVGEGAIRQGICQVHGGLHCNCPPPYQDRDIFEVTEQAAVDVSPFMAKVFSLFPDADPDFVKQKLQTVAQSVPDPVQWVCNLMLEDSYPRKQVPVRPKTPPPSTSKPKELDYINKWRELPRIQNRHHYIAEARQVLAFAFKLLSMASIDEVMRATNYRFTPAFVVLEKIVQSKEYIKAEKSNQRPPMYHSNHPNLSICCELPGEKPGLPDGKKFEERRFRIKLNRKPRTSMMPCKNEELKREMEYYNNFVREKQEEQDHQMALHVNQEEYEQNQQGIECECCFVEYPFENMVQCFEMHLFCSDCLQNYVKEAIFGQGKGNLVCMATDCSSTFPRDQIEKTLPADMLVKYDERCREESVHLADLEDLVRCPHCQFAATLALEMKAFLCPQCGRETCRNCQQDWKEHFGKKCEELESRSEEQLRTKYEEKLTEALIRKCHRCKASIVKENGCNKMTCRCGAKMCYICRKPDIDYNHFCRHVRDPSRKGCNKCNACCLWEVAEVVDTKKMSEIMDEMKKEQEEKGVDEKKRPVGVPENIGGGPSKKPRTQ